MELEVITDNDTLLIRRLRLAPGEPMFWHSDACRRFTVVVAGSKLAIEYRDSSEQVAVDVHPGMAGWDEPDDRTHRAINRGGEAYEEVVTFYKASPDVIPQPGCPA